MEFALRDATVADLDACLEMLSSRHLCDRENLGNLRRLWAHLLVSRGGMMCVVADARVPSRVVHFATVVFVRDDRADGYHRCETPKIAMRMLDEWIGGGRPFLDAREIARANASSGLNVVVLHFGRIPDELIGKNATEELRTASYESGRRALRGWNLRSYTNEVFTRNPPRDGKQMGEALGFRLGRYSLEQLKAAGIEEREEPWVWMATREDAAGVSGVAIGELFHTFAPPRFGFSRSEQELLALALDGHTDASIAQIAGASIATVKKRFRTIYERVHDAGASQDGFSPPLLNGVRGAETRRHVLNYLREHPGELHPYDARKAIAP